MSKDENDSAKLTAQKQERSRKQTSWEELRAYDLPDPGGGWPIISPVPFLPVLRRPRSTSLVEATQRGSRAPDRPSAGT